MAHFLSHYNNWRCGPGSFAHGPFGLVLTLLFGGMVIYFLVKLVSLFWSSRSVGRTCSLKIVQQRYARGEIDETTYRKIKKELSSA